MKNLFTYLFIYIMPVCLLAGCIQEFIPRGVSAERGVLVIDGMIRNGESVFKLSYSVGIADTLDSGAFIDEAEVYVETNDGERFPALFAGQGAYVAQIPALDDRKYYRLVACIEEETFLSEYLQPLAGVDIDSIFMEKKERGGPVNLYVASHDEDKHSIYYRWNYRETWEVRAELYANARWGTAGSVVFHSLNTPENTYYCWGRDSSKNILLASTEKLQENRIARQKLLEIPCDHDKLSILYHLEAEQMHLREAAYKYMKDAQEGFERDGNLFAPVRTNNIRGNIRTLNDPNRLVIGYIEVANVTRTEKYFREKDHDYYESPRTQCSNMVYNWGIPSPLPIYVYLQSKVSANCVDCRTKENASKNKPAGWPTEHL